MKIYFYVVIVSFLIASVVTAQDNILIPFRNKDKWGFSDTNKKIIIPCKFEDAEPFKNGLAHISMGVRNYGWINKDGNILNDTLYEDLIDFQDSIAAVSVSLSLKWGFINLSGKFIIPPTFEFEDVSLFSEGLARFKKGNNWGYINIKGEIIIQPEYGESKGFIEGFAAVGHNNKWGFIDKTGKVIVPLIFDKVDRCFRDGLAGVYKAGSWGFVNKSGEIVIPLIYDEMSTGFQEGLACVKKGQYYGYINKLGKTIIPFKYEWAMRFKEGIAMVSDGLGLPIYYIDKNGKAFLKDKYNDYSDFFEGFAFVGKKLGTITVYGFIDKKGKEITQFKYEDTYHFYNGYAVVRFNNKMGFIDKNGKEVIEPKYEYDKYVKFQNGLVKVNYPNRESFYIDANGREYYID